MGTHPIFESDFDCLTENDGTSDGPKMQITVPKFSTSQGGWTEFHIFIDNVFHPAVRYRKLSRLYNDCVRGRRLLRRRGSNVTETIPRFPPKGSSDTTTSSFRTSTTSKLFMC